MAITNEQKESLHELIIRQDKGKNNKLRPYQLARKLDGEYETGISAKHLAILITRYRQTGTLPGNVGRPATSAAKLSAQGLGHDKYSMANGNYTWHADKGDITIPIDEADQMFYEYSRHGLDMSQSQIRQKHNLKIWEWHAIKNTLFLYKDANIFSPHTEEHTPQDQLESMLEQKMEFKFKDKQHLIESAYNKETIRQYKKTIHKDNIQTFALENLADELHDVMRDWSSKTATVKRTKDFGSQRKWILATIADLHVGAKVENLKLTPEYNPQILRQRLDQTARRINATGATDVSIAFLGDLIESFTGLNHPNSWQSIEYGMIGAKLIKETMSVLEEFIAKVDNVREIIGISGNHDRITASKKEDSKGQVAEIIFYMLQRLYANNIDIQYSDLAFSKQIDGIQYVLVHGDKKITREGKQVVIDHGDSKLYNVIIGAHIHCRRVLEDERSYRWIIAPAIFSGNRYSEENAWHAQPGFLTIENDGTGKPIITDHTLS